MTVRMTAQRLSRLIADGDAAAVRSAVDAQPGLLTAPVERDGVGGWTPLHVAVATAATEVVAELVAAGADVTARTEDGRTPLHVALQHSPDLVAQLRSLGAPVDAASAAFLGDTERLAGELDAGARLHDPVTDVDLLTLAASGGSVAAVELLLARGADPDAGALHAAAATGRPDVVECLLAAGAAVDRRDPGTGRTPLHAAVSAGPDQGDAATVVGLLLNAGADVNATTNDGASALDISRVAAARRRAEAAGRAGGHDALTDALVAAGATN